MILIQLGKICLIVTIKNCLLTLLAPLPALEVSSLSNSFETTTNIYMKNSSSNSLYSSSNPNLVAKIAYNSCYHPLYLQNTYYKKGKKRLHNLPWSLHIFFKNQFYYSRVYLDNVFEACMLVSKGSKLHTYLLSYKVHSICH